jgi:hypothetical protein
MSNENENNSNILHLESLVKQYDTLLIQYTQVQTDYINFLKVNVTTNQTNSSTNSKLVSIKGSTFWGTSGISSSNVSSVGQCSALCSSTSGCTGATYNSNSGTQNNCFLRSGDGDVIAGTTSQYAIVPQNKEYLLTLQNLNAQLMQVNSEISNFIQTNSSMFSTQNNDRLEQYKILQQNFEELAKERIRIASELSQFQSLNEKQGQSELIVTKNYYSYILLLFLVIICLFFVGRIVINSNNEKTEANINVFAIIFIIFIITFLLFMLIAFFQRRQINLF